MALIFPLVSKFDDKGLQTAKSELKKFSSGFKGALGGIGLSLGIGQVVDVLKSAVEEASNLNEQGGAVQQVFGKGAVEIKKFAAGAAQSLGQSNTQILEAAKTFGIFGKAAGLTGKKNAGFSETLVKLATDLASFNNTSVDDALTALSAGLRGESEPLRRFGVLLDDAALKAQAMNMGIYKGKGPLTQQQKILAANAAILKQTSTQQGDFARTSGGLANQQRILTASWTNAKATLGQALLPMLTQFVQTLNRDVIPVVQKFFDDLSNPKSDVGKAFKDLKTAIGDTMATVGDFFKQFDPKKQDGMVGFTNVLQGLVKALPAILALKGVFIAMAGVKNVMNLITLLKTFFGKGGSPSMPTTPGTPMGSPGGKGKPSGPSKVPSNVPRMPNGEPIRTTPSKPGTNAKTLIAAALAAYIAGAGALAYEEVSLTFDREKMQRSVKNLRAKNPAFANAQAQYLAMQSGGMGSKPITQNNHVNVHLTTNDPNAVVDALKKYTKINGPLPKTITGK